MAVVDLHLFKIYAEIGEFYADRSGGVEDAAPLGSPPGGEYGERSG